MYLLLFDFMSAMHGRPGSPKVLTVQIVYTHLLQSVHFKYFRSPSHILACAIRVMCVLGVFPGWVDREFCWIV